MNSERQAAQFFLPQEAVDRITPFGSGNVNDTFLVILKSADQRVLQRLNPDIFPDPAGVVRNTRLVTDHLQEAIEHEQDCLAFRPAAVYAGEAGDSYSDREGGAWRMTEMITNSRTCQCITTVNQAKELGRTLGLFHRLLSTLDPEKLIDPLPGFHDTLRYLRHYDLVIASLDAGSGSEYCRNFIDSRRAMTGLLEGHGKQLRHAIIHGDPKVANFLFDETGMRVLSLIDLDTVKPGLLLHDLGDALRSACNPVGETPGLQQEPVFDIPLFQGWLTGYLSEAGFLLTETDRERIVDAVLLITFELGLRFYTDFLEGNRYFKVSDSGQNLERAIAQFQLVRSIEHQSKQLAAIVNDLVEGIE